MAVTQLKDGRWIDYYRRGTIAKDPNRTREYFGRESQGGAAARERDAQLSFARRRPRGGKKRDRPSAIWPMPIFPNFSENSTKHLIIRLKANLMPFFGAMPVIDLTDDKVDQYVNMRRETVKNSTIARELTDLKTILNWAAKRRPPMIPFNPIRILKNRRRMML